MIIFNAFTCSQYTGVTTYIDKLSGELEVLFGLPINRSTLLIGKMFSAGIRTLLESLVLIFTANVITNFNLSLTYEKCFYMIIIAIIFACLSSLVFTSISSLIKSQDSFNIIINLITMPIIFTSSVFYPLKNFPRYLSIFAMINPLTYFITLMRKVLFGIQIGSIKVFILFFFLIFITFYISKLCFSRSLS